MKRNEHLPLMWFLFLAATFGSGAAVLHFDVFHLPQLSDVRHAGRQICWAPLVGIVLMGIPVAQVLTYMALAGTKRLFNLKGNSKREHLWPPAIIGFVESLMYPSALLLGRAEFIGVWLALKVAGQWGYWNVDHKLHPLHTETHLVVENEPPQMTFAELVHEGRRRYYQSLIGNALSVLFGCATYFAVILWATAAEPIIPPDAAR